MLCSCGPKGRGGLLRIGGEEGQNKQKKMYLSIILIPLISAISAGLFGRYLGSKGAGIFTTTSIGITSLLS
jgi:hypothetical protein